jgi:hypothetical protein
MADTLAVKICCDACAALRNSRGMPVFLRKRMIGDLIRLWRGYLRDQLGDILNDPHGHSGCLDALLMCYEQECCLFDSLEAELCVLLFCITGTR